MLTSTLEMSLPPLPDVSSTGASQVARPGPTQRDIILMEGDATKAVIALREYFPGVNPYVLKFYRGNTPPVDETNLFKLVDSPVVSVCAVVRRPHDAILTPRVFGFAFDQRHSREVRGRYLTQLFKGDKFGAVAFYVPPPVYDHSATLAMTNDDDDDDFEEKFGRAMDAVRAKDRTHPHPADELTDVFNMIDDL